MPEKGGDGTESPPDSSPYFGMRLWRVSVILVRVRPLRHPPKRTSDAIRHAQVRLESVRDEVVRPW